MNKKIITGAVSAAVLSLSGVVYADTTGDLVNALVTKGVLTEEEGALLSKGHDKKKANTPVLTNKGGKFKIQSADGKNEIGLTGRMHFDYRNSDLDDSDLGNTVTDEYDVDGKSLSSSEFEMRRARIGIKGKLDGIWKYDVVLNANGKSGKNLDTASLTFAPKKAFNIQFGRFKQAFNLEGLTSSNDIDFNERSFINQISPHKKLGIALKGAPTKGMTYMVSKYQEGYSDSDSENENNYSARLTYNWAEANKIKDSIFHVGFSGFSEDYQHTPKTSSNGGTGGTTHSKFMKFKSAGRGYSPLVSLEIEGETLAGGGASSKGKVNNQIDAHMYGLEGILAKGPFKLQGEFASGSYQGRNMVRNAEVEADIKAAYLTASYVLTGEHYAKSYKGGKMKGIKVANPFDFENGTGTGAWEVAARYEYLDVDNVDITNGSTTKTRVRGAFDCNSATAAEYGEGTDYRGCSAGAKQYTIGLKWIANPNVLAKISYTYSDYDNDIIAPDTSETETFDSEQLLQTRIQWMF
jgi:phosphate-selective porin OprO/OprP